MFLAAVIARKLNLDGTPVVVPEKETTAEPDIPTLPKWCRVGQWVFHSDSVLCQIVKVQEHQILVHCPNTKLKLRIFDFSSIRPVRFRIPTLEEAYGWLGKVMEFKDGTRELICIVGEDEVTGEDMGTERMLFVNRKPAECLQSCSIDRLPFGVPEVDEEAEAQK